LPREVVGKILDAGVRCIYSKSMLNLPPLLRRVVCLLLFSVLPAAWAAEEAKPVAAVKLLTIGNSFADNATAFLPQMAKAGGHELTLFRANLGGHSFQQHVGYLRAFEVDANDPKGHVYAAKNAAGAQEKWSLRQALENQPWDVVTIQQVSNLSYKFETFQPDANVLIDYVHKNAPTAKVMILETWGYPADYLAKSNFKDTTAETMPRAVKEAYAKLAAETGLAIIPVGDAFQAALTQKPDLRLNMPADKHANKAGQYLGAAVLYEALFHDSAEANPFKPADVPDEDAKFLRHVAHETVAGQQK
jgi:hypothetical protein